MFELNLVRNWVGGLTRKEVTPEELASKLRTNLKPYCQAIRADVGAGGWVSLAVQFDEVIVLGSLHPSGCIFSVL